MGIDLKQPTWERRTKDPATVLSDLQAIDSGITGVQFDDDGGLTINTPTALTQNQIDAIANYSPVTMILDTGN